MEGGIETGIITVLENVIFTKITKRSVIAEDPEKVIQVLNNHTPRTLNPANEYHFEIAQELLTLYIQLN